MKKIALVLLCQICWLATSLAQDKYFTRNGVISFKSVTPVETIESSNKEVNIILDPATGSVAFKVTMKSFAFEKQGIKDHFNDTYLNTDQYPNASFQGKITDLKNFSVNGKYNVTVEGDLTIHGVTKSIKQKGIVVIESGKISVSSAFDISLADYKVSIPNNYIKRISNAVQVDVDGTLTVYQR